MSAELWFGIFSLAIGAIGAIFSLLASIIAYFVKRGEDAQDKSIDALHGENRALRDDLDGVRQALASYETHVGAGDARLAEIRSDIADHVKKEEQIFWKKVDAMSEAQRIFSEAVLQRVASMEAKMPNGELREMGLAIARIETGMSVIGAKADAASRHVEDHDKEAEDWKRRIVALESQNDSVRRRNDVRAKK